MKKVLITLPVYNEEKIIYENTKKLIQHIEKIPKYKFIVNIVCNGCNDNSNKLALKLKKEFHKWIEVDSIPEKGRGYALKYSWKRSDADILCYMDMDLSTDLKHINDLIKNIDSGYDLCIGSRYINKSNIKRDFLRFLLSKAYNFITINLFDLKIHDTQCGFKAISKKSKKIFKKVKDNDWFFDTELIIKAKNENLRIIEIPVSWKENKSSKVKFGKTSLYFLKKLIQMKKETLFSKI